ncbi:hypothetical protein ABZ348_00395 [Streptomyces sp. NPDC005963]|uniref:hypothetical protein n=1 Tax=Streptomyces sp. NPDC005963 TaxID=3156721 RepID=UPI0033D717D2
MVAQEDQPDECRPVPLGRDAARSGDVSADPSGIQPLNGTAALHATDTGSAYAGPGGFANTGIVQLVMDANAAEHFSTALVWRLLKAIDSLESHLRRLDDGPLAPTRDIRTVQAERTRLRKRLRLAEAQLRRAKADKKRANQLRKSAEQRAEKWALRHARTGQVPQAPAHRQRLIEPAPSPRVQGDDHGELLRDIAHDLDRNARELGRLRGLLRAGRRNRPVTVLIAVVVVLLVAVVLKTSSTPGSGAPEVHDSKRRAADGLTASPFHSVPPAPSREARMSPSATPDAPDAPDAQVRRTSPAPRPSSSPVASSNKSAPRPSTPRKAAPPPAPASRATGQIFIVRGHRNEMNVNLTGFEPDEDVMIYAYTDADSTDGPFDQRIHTVDADGNREFGAFPMEAPGRYWVVASGVKSNVITWSG